MYIYELIRSLQKSGTVMTTDNNHNPFELLKMIDINEKYKRIYIYDNISICSYNIYYNI